jgi:cobalt-zinc-cadmium efflux system outer membrane protein
MSKPIGDAQSRPRRAPWRVLASAAVLLLTSLAATSAAAEREPVVTLQQMIDYAEQHAPALRLARVSRGLAAAAVEGAAPVLHENPSLSLAAGPRSASGHSSSLDLSASLRQPVELAGERGLRRGVARRFAERLEAELGATLSQVRRDVDLAYHASVVARERVAVSARLLAFAERALEVAQRRLAAGDIGRIEVTLAEVDVASAREAWLRARQTLAAARLELASSAGWPPRTPPMVPEGLLPVSPVPELEASLQQALDRHPALAAQRAATREADARVALADREAWPAPTLGVQLAREGSVGSPANFIVLGSVELDLPLWSRNPEQRAASRAERDIAREQALLGSRSLEVSLLAAHAALAAAAERIGQLGSDARGAFDHGLSLLERGLANGEFSALTVSAARERLAQAELLVLDAYADYYRARAELTHALGAAPSAAADSPAVEPGGTP